MSSIEDKPSLLFHQNYLQNILPYLDNKDVAVLLQLNTKCNETGNKAITMLAEMEARSAPLQNDEKTKLQVPAKKRWTDYRKRQEIARGAVLAKKFTQVYALRRLLLKRMKRIDQNRHSFSFRRRIINLLNPVNLALVSCGEIVVLTAEIVQGLFLGIRGALAASTQPTSKTLAMWHFRKLGCDIVKLIIAALVIYPLAITYVYFVFYRENPLDFAESTLNHLWNAVSISKKIQDNEREAILQCTLASLPDKIPENEDIIFWDHLGREWKLQHGLQDCDLVAAGASRSIPLSDPFIPNGNRIAKKILVRLAS